MQSAYLLLCVAKACKTCSHRQDWNNFALCMQDLGGAKYHFLTHQDDVAGHDKWCEALGTERIIHSTETNSSQGTE